ncbi:ATP-binding protein [Deinococcus antarcticus]|uniref:histidine kinase n=1 Tax=Deinococcus antarcticus TaxID=1298767 RepID=A0ABV8A963_9DEIO
MGAYETQGRSDHVLLVVTDITPYRRAHRTLLDVTATQEGHLKEQAARVRALNQELEGVVTTFIQQLQLPVARALNLLGLLCRALGEPPEEVTKPLLNTERALQQIVTLFKTMERYMDVRRMPARVRPVDLNRVLREVLKDAQPLLVERDVRITQDPLPTVQGDSQALSVIFTEYISNALKFTRGRQAAHVHVSVRETESEYHLGVEDNGVGFNTRQKDKLFQIFGRLHSSSVYEGTGVGLASARRLAERFGGRVWAEGKIDQGATFWLAWPKQPTVSQ